MKQTLYQLTTNGNNLRIELVIMESKKKKNNNNNNNNNMHWLAGTQLRIS